MLMGLDKDNKLTLEFKSFIIKSIFLVDVLLIAFFSNKIFFIFECKMSNGLVGILAIKYFKLLCLLWILYLVNSLILSKITSTSYINSLISFTIISAASEGVDALTSET